MSLFNRLRLYHTALAALAGLAYVSEDWTSLHVLIGYVLISTIGLRVVSLIFGGRLLPRPAWLMSRQDHQLQLGLSNPIISKGLIAGIMLSLAATISTGLLLDQNRLPNSAEISLITAAHADEDRKGSRKDRNKGSKFLKNVHEAAANGIFALVGLHIAYLLLRHRRMALRMIFIEPPRKS